MTMIELLVAMIIGVGVVLAVSTLLVAGENHKRTTTSTNDADQAGAYTFHSLDKALRGAGSAIAESTLAYPNGAGVLGCRLNAATILPAAALPAPFATAFLGGAPSNLRVAPVLIGKHQSDSIASDVIVVMSGSGAAGGVSRAITQVGSAPNLVLQGTTGFSVNDLVLVSQPSVTDCLIEEVNSVSASTLNVGGTPYYNAATASTLTAMSSSTLAFVTPLGNVGTAANVAVNNVQFTLFGVGTNYTLYSYDLLQYQYLVLASGTKTSEAITDGVVQMNAIYGIQSTTAPGVLYSWADPGIAPYDINDVMTNPATQQSIIAVRVAIVVRGEYYDKNVVSPSSLTIFSGYTDGPNGTGNSLQQTVQLNTIPGGQNYRYRVFEFTVPLRNMLLLAGA